MYADSTKRFTVEDIQKDFPDKKKVKKWLKENVPLAAVPFLLATYSVDTSVERWKWLYYSNYHTMLSRHVHIDSYKKEDGTWRMQILSTVADNIDTKVSQYYQVFDLIKRINLIYTINPSYAQICDRGILYTFDIDPKIVNAITIKISSLSKEEELPF